MTEKEPVKEVQRNLTVPYHWSYGESFTKFFEATKERKVILGSRCPVCRGVLVPCIDMCGRCFCDTDEIVELPDEGELVSFTVVYLPFPGQPKEPPYAYGYILFDGAGTMFAHMIGECEFEDIEVGMRVKAVWNEDRKGDLFDIKYFKPI